VRPALLLVVLVAAVGCGGAPDAPQPGAAPSAALLAPTDTAAAAASSAPTPAAPDEPVALQDLEVAELLELNQPWTGDFDGMIERRFVRVLVTPNRTNYYLDKAEQRGIAADAMREFEKYLVTKTPKGRIAPKVAIIPVSRDRMLQALVSGLGDLAVGGFPIRASLETQADYSVPTIDKVRDLVVSGPGAPPIRSLGDLAGQSVWVRPGSGYHEELSELSRQLVAEGRPAIDIRSADARLEDEDILQMVDAGVMPITVMNDLLAGFWSQTYDRITVHEGLELASNGRMAWGLRKGTPVFSGLVNEFVREHRAGTLFGNLVLKRYLGSVDRLRNPTHDDEMQRFRTVVDYFRKFGEQYEIDWLLAASQGYQESRLDQSVRSRAGAVGIMQIKPETARDLGITDVGSAENNIQAGIKYLRWVADTYYKDAPMDRLDKGLFALASYNAGPARIRGLRTKAEKAGLDPNQWFNNVELMAAREIGRETVDYVSNIYKYYVAYSAIVASRQTAAAPAR